MTAPGWRRAEESRCKVYRRRDENSQTAFERAYPEARFGGFSDVDGTIAFYGRVRALVEGGAVVLDVGCGRGGGCDDVVRYRREIRSLRGRAGRVIGIDVD